MAKPLPSSLKRCAQHLPRCYASSAAAESLKAVAKVAAVVCDDHKAICSARVRDQRQLFCIR